MWSLRITWKGCEVAGNQGNKIAWDSTVIIDCLQKKVGRYEWVEPLIKEAESDGLMIVVSALALAEAFRVDGQPATDDLQIIESFFDRPYIYPESATTHIGKIARDLRRDYGIDGIDAMHVATAIGTGCEFFLTNDGEARKKKTPLLPLDGKIPIDGSRFLRVMTPKQYQEMKTNAAMPLFDPKNAPSASTQPQTRSPTTPNAETDAPTRNASPT